MQLEYIGVKGISGPLIILDGISGVSYDELVEIKVEGGGMRLGKVVEISEESTIVQVFEGTQDLSLNNTTTRFLGHPFQLPLSKEILGRVFDGLGRPKDNLGAVYPHVRWDINGKPVNPVSRKYPRNYINTGISTIDGLTTLIRGQKLPIFSANGLPHDQLTEQLVRQAKLSSEGESNFAIVFAAIGVHHDVAETFRKSFEESGVIQKVAMFLNLSNDPVTERIITPRCALTAAEYMAYELEMHVLVVLTDMSAYCEALRELSASRGEIPSRKGFPGYMYSDLTSIYERAGMVKEKNGSITQIPILTMPSDDITHPIPDLTGYITEGQIVLDRNLYHKGIYPPINILPSLSRLIKDGTGKGITREDHGFCARQLFASYSKVQEVRSLASVIGEDELSQVDKLYMEFGRAFEKDFVCQNIDKDRTMEQTLNIGWKVLGILPKKELDRVDSKILDKYHKPRQHKVQKKESF
ncbi:V-type ATP synthase subunit B [Herbivorax sp. ANBcel31]|uniref:V-type ATP synthase subunit B n=1 Tax=Herbivorax sp. ANBcel31 TaxID=3069754 RepID=UPI0027AE9D1E|nr:V-type ATP synthase subunit B [Herbivorax sp. ANBcel31]MDQ2087264.1 V-type ATP synthase subunit B [Herbivorax sp. ANBcel31]